MKILVTGASGALARKVVHRLTDDGHSVLGIDRRPWPDAPDGEGDEKVALVLSLLEAHVPPHAPGGRIYLWWDYASITQPPCQ